MLRKLRRGSKDTVDDAPRTGRQDSAFAVVTQEEEPNLKQPGFFDLPAEIRNAIYESIVSETTLSLPSSIFAVSKRSNFPLMKRKSPPPPINGLLLTSRQCRREYLSVLLSSVSIQVEVKDFEFESLMRVSSALSEADLKALHCNPNLVINLSTRNCTSKALSCLRRWLDYRNKDGINLPWKYEFPLEAHMPPTPMGRVRLMRELEYYADSISTLAVDVNATQQAELQLIVEAFERNAVSLEEDLGWLSHRTKSTSRDVRGLPGGGVV